MRLIAAACLLLNLGLPLSAAGYSGVRLLRSPSKRWEAFFLASLSVFLFAVLTQSFLVWLGAHYTLREDLYAAGFDQAFGQPSFAIGRLLEAHPLLNLAARTGYSLLFSAMLAVLGLYFLTRPLEDAVTVVRTMYTALTGMLVAIALPISGPLYAFHHFPNLNPAGTEHPIQLTAPPNGFPSLHMTMAILILYFASRWRVGTLLGAAYLVLIVLSTLGTGEHYFIDLLAAVPFSALVIYLGGASPATETYFQLQTLKETL